MSEAALSRRDLIAQSVPALAAGATLFAAAQTLAQDAPAAAQAPSSQVLEMLQQASRDGQYQLPKLPYGYDALEPHIDAQTMELHHSKHHNAYVTGLNKTLDDLNKLREADDIDPARLSALSRNVSFNAGGHIFHTIFFGIMSGGKKGEMGPLPVTDDIVKQYGTLEKFQNHFSKVAAGVKGSGWAIAFYEPIADKILITETGDQDLRLIPGGIPLVLIDVWEHAYYLKYQNKRADYIKAWWNALDWGEVNALYAAVRAMYKKA